MNGKEFLKFLNSEKHYILHFYAPKNSDKSENIYTLLQSKPIVDSGYKPVWINLRYAQQNMVIEHFITDIYKKMGHVIKNRLEGKTWSDLFANNCYSDVDNIKDIHILVNDFRKKIINKLDLENNCIKFLMVLDNAENIFGSHLALNKKGWESDVKNQWTLFLRKMIELNSRYFKLKVILIANTELCRLTEVENYISYCDKIPAKGSVNTPIPEILLIRLSKNIKGFFSLLNKDDKITDYRTIKEYIKKNIKDSAGLINKIKKGKDINPELLIYTGFLDYIPINYGYHDELIGFIRKNQYNNRSDQISNILSAEKDINNESVMLLRKLFFDIKDKYLNFNNFIRYYYNKIVFFIKTDTSIGDLEILKLEFSLYRWIKEIERVLSTNNGGRNGLQNFNGFEALTRLICLPIHEFMFTDIGITLQQYGYNKHFSDMLRDIKRNTGDALPEHIGMRLKVLAGNLYYYNYPEDYPRALEHYVEALKDYRKYGENCGGYECHHLDPKRFGDCYLIHNLTKYEIISTFYQIVIRNLPEKTDLRGQATLWDCIKRLNKKTPIRRIRWLRLKRVIASLETKTDNTRLRLLTKYILLMSRVLINMMIEERENTKDYELNYSGRINRIDEPDHGSCWLNLLNIDEKTMNEIVRHKKKDNSASGRDKAYPNPSALSKNQFQIIKERIKVALLKYYEMKNLSGHNLLRVLGELNLNNIKKIRLFQPFMALFRNYVNLFPLRSLKRLMQTIENTILGLKTNTDNILCAARNKEEIQPSRDFYWDYLVHNHTSVLLVKELEAAIRRTRILQSSRYLSKRHRKIETLIKNSIELLVKSAESIKEFIIDSAKRKDQKLTPRTQETWRLARTYELLGDIYRLKIFWINGNFSQESQSKLAVIYRQVLLNYNDARERYLRIGSYDHYEKIIFKVDEVQAELKAR